MENNYGVEQIKDLGFREGCRERISMYLGSDDLNGTYQAIKEIVNNSTDEAMQGYGKKIIIEFEPKLNMITITDFGRGIPFGKNEAGKDVLISVVTELHSGGKFDKNAYKNSSGLNGCGASVVNNSSKMFKVESRRDGIEAKAIFAEGILDTYTEEKTSKPNGTTVTFIPDEKVFHNGEIGYDYDRICEEIREVSYLNANLTFEVICGDQKHVYCAKNGIKDYVKDHIDKPINKVINYYKVSDGTDTIEIAYQWGVKYETPVVFVNGLKTPEGGSPVTAAKTAITKVINSLAGTKLSGDAIRSNLLYVINCTVAEPSFANQTKSKINNESLRPLASQAFTESLKDYQQKNGDDFTRVIEMLTKIDKANEAAERARQQVLNTNKEIEQRTKAKISNPDKLRDARKTGKDATLLVVEGLSAGGSMSIGRDPNKYGILMLRGKAKNLLNCSIDEGLENEEVKLMMQALGIYYNKPYNESKLRYGKVAIASDSDFDGSHIGLLIISMLHVLCPDLIKSNKLFWLRAPIYKVATPKKNYYYYTEEEFVGHPNGEITKFKGLGQMDDADLKESMFSEQWQRLEPITYTESGIIMLEQLMGPKVDPRKDFVMNKIDFTTFTVE